LVSASNATAAALLELDALDEHPSLANIGLRLVGGGDRTSALRTAMQEPIARLQGKPLPFDRNGVRELREPQITPHPAQQEFLDAVESGQYNYLAYGGGIRGGKSYALITAILRLCRKYPGSRWAIVRKDLPTLRRNTIPTFYRLRPRSFCGPVKQDTWTATCENGSEIIFFPESITGDPDLERWKGLEVNGFGLEEASELQHASMSKSIERAGSWILTDETGAPLPQHMQPNPLVLLTFNPTPLWPRKLFFEPWKRGTLAAPWFFRAATISDNPHIPESYKASLTNLPEPEYKRFVLGDWTVVQGSALYELDDRKHFIAPFDVPRHWTRFGAFDWGFAHPFIFYECAVNEDGRVFVLQTVKGRRLADDQILERIKVRVDVTRLRYAVAGHDCWGDRKKDGTPTVHERFAEGGLVMTQASTARVAGLQNLNDFLRWREVGAEIPGRVHEDGRPVREDDDPALVFFDNPGNRAAVEVLKTIMRDPNDPEDALKVNADSETGEGGDDEYDCLRYALASRPPRAIGTGMDARVRAFSPASLAADADTRKHNTHAPGVRRGLRSYRGEPQ
jgi:hypothetical protein